MSLYLWQQPYPFDDEYVYDTVNGCWTFVFMRSQGQSLADRVADANDQRYPRFSLWSGVGAGLRTIICAYVDAAGQNIGQGNPTYLDKVPRGWVGSEKSPAAYFGSNLGSFTLHRWGTAIIEATQTYPGLDKWVHLQRYNNPGYTHVMSGQSLGLYNPSSSNIDRVLVLPE